MLVTYSNGNNIVTDHLSLFTILFVCNGEIIFEGIKFLSERPKLPCTNLLAILMDSCSVMRGSKSSLEKGLRDSVAPHLLDINGDIWHHIHNIVQKFPTTFGNFLENLFQGIFRDFHLSSDLLHQLKEICYYLSLILGVTSDYLIVCCFFCFRLNTSFIFSLKYNSSH